MFSFDCNRYLRAFQLRDGLLLESAPGQPDCVEAVDARAIAHGLSKWQRIFGHDRVSANVGMPADAAELMHPEKALIVAKSSTVTWPPTVAALPKIVKFPIWQSCATCTYAMNRF